MTCLGLTRFSNGSAESVYWRTEHAERRTAIFAGVLLLHAMIGILLMRTSSLLTVRINPQELLLSIFGNSLSRKPAEANPAPVKPGLNENSRAKRANARREAPASALRPPVSDALASITPNDFTLLPPIDWEHEAEAAVQSRMAATEREKRYRNLAGLSAAQLEWIRKNHMEPVDSNPPWSETHPRNNADGVFWINDNCAIVDFMPVCRIKLGSKKPRGDLFRDMRKYLDERETDPLP